MTAPPVIVTVPAELGSVERRAVPGFEGRYEVSSDGRVRSLLHAEIIELKQRLSPNGYPVVTLYTGKRGAPPRTVHSLMALAFYGPAAAPSAEVRHLDGIKTNNAIQNLRWGTKSENRLDSVAHGTHRNAAKTHCPAGHPYVTENIATPEKPGWRKCLPCRRDRYRRTYVPVARRS